MNPDWFNVLSFTLALVLVVIFLVVPMFAISMFGTYLLLGGSHAAGGTVGMGVILRATIRRIFRSGVRSVMQTSMSTFTRTTARAVTRRVVRVAMKSLLTVLRTLLLQKKGASQTEQSLAKKDPADQPTPVLAILLGFVALFLSLWAILHLLALDDTPFRQAAPQLGAALAGVTQGPLPLVVGLEAAAVELPHDTTLQQVPTLLVALLGAVPLLVYTLLVMLAGRWLGVQTSFQTGLDGLLLQAYFTGGGSFLPLTTDIEYRGPTRATAAAATISLGGMFAIHLLLYSLALATSWASLQVASAMFLLYCFVFSFPIKPLDGQYLWASSRWLWLLCWLPILASFLVTLPESINAIL